MFFRLFVHSRGTEGFIPAGRPLTAVGVGADGFHDLQSMAFRYRLAKVKIDLLRTA
jgi:hypothetical protein